ncbi:MAG: cation-efflux pump [SAR86 cluster bacterium]|uniref:Cation-efflux pump n=1 Tax=SAR86 cluster bacterium TaxID=2030880 RepID=A0A2A4WV43_9GAMM|nr:MAG: cation-efflux pump [SAR86 cluster bacterium]
MDAQQAKREATNVTLVGMLLDLLLGVGKIVGGVVTNSFALITDGIHSLSDAGTDIFVLIVARLAHAEPDAEHQYGHGRFETLGTIAMGIVFFITAAILLYDSFNRLRLSEPLPTPAAAGIAIALLSVATKEWIYHYTMRVAKKLNSNLLKANAWHSRTDAISSVAVLIGIVGARQGYLWMDTAAGMVVALIIAKIGWELCSDSLTELVDTAVSKHRREQFESCILSIDGIRGITELRSRSSGGKIILEVRLLVNSYISVSEGHQLGERVNKSLISRFGDVSEVLIHIDPIQHENTEDESQLPERSQVIASLKACWKNLIDQHLQTALQFDRL